MRRPQGSGLVENEIRVLRAARDLHATRERWSIAELLRRLADDDPTRKLMNEATAYRIAGRFGDKGWLGNAWRLPDDDTERPRREYWLTEAGLSAASDADSRAGVGDGPDFAKVHSATSI